MTSLVDDENAEQAADDGAAADYQSTATGDSQSFSQTVTSAADALTNGTVLEGTTVHPIWSPELNNWAPMGDFKPGDFVLARSGWPEVAKTELLTRSQPVYNLEINAEHVYEVTDDAILVHNACPSGAPNGLPATTADSVADKLRRYLLDPNHPVGGDKATWFRKALGFIQDNLDDLARQIKVDPSKAIATELTQHGQKFEQVIQIVGANGKQIDVLFVWIRNNDGVVRLVTSTLGV